MRHGYMGHGNECTDARTRPPGSRPASSVSSVRKLEDKKEGDYYGYVDVREKTGKKTNKNSHLVVARTGGKQKQGKTTSVGMDSEAKMR